MTFGNGIATSPRRAVASAAHLKSAILRRPFARSFATVL